MENKTDDFIRIDKLVFGFLANSSDAFSTGYRTNCKDKSWIEVYKYSFNKQAENDI